VKEVFADTYYFLALLNSADEAHDPAAATAQSLDARIVTTTWVLTELADALAGTVSRNRCAAFIEELRHKPQFVVVPASEPLFEAGLALYRNRSDKEWSLTDCVSFVVMGERRIGEALTGDHHFAQAGFTALLE
jgi:hypothetical protein